MISISAVEFSHAESGQLVLARLATGLPKSWFGVPAKEVVEFWIVRGVETNDLLAGRVRLTDSLGLLTQDRLRGAVREVLGHQGVALDADDLQAVVEQVQRLYAGRAW